MILTLDFIFVTLGSQKTKTQYLQTTEGKGYSPDTHSQLKCHPLSRRKKLWTCKQSENVTPVFCHILFEENKKEGLLNR